MPKSNAQKNALLQGLTHYISQKPCKRCGGVKRYSISGLCSNLECRRQRDAEWKQKNQARAKVNNRRRKVKQFGLTLEDYDKMYQKQSCGCAICGAPKSEKERSLAVDHDHKTNKVRGLLCNKCNQGLGFFNDNIDLLQEAVLYLKQHSE